jgi:hypothetical protein
VHVRLLFHPFVLPIESFLDKEVFHRFVCKPLKEKMSWIVSLLKYPLSYFEWTKDDDEDEESKTQVQQEEEPKEETKETLAYRFLDGELTNLTYSLTKQIEESRKRIRDVMETSNHPQVIRRRTKIHLNDLDTSLHNHVVFSTKRMKEYVGVTFPREMKTLEVPKEIPSVSSSEPASSEHTSASSSPKHGYEERFDTLVDFWKTKVLQTIQASTKDEGISMNELSQTLQLPKEHVNDFCQDLLDEKLVYTTLDSSHVKACLS